MKQSDILPISLRTCLSILLIFIIMWIAIYITTTPVSRGVSQHFSFYHLYKIVEFVVVAFFCSVVFVIMIYFVEKHIGNHFLKTRINNDFEIFKKHIKGLSKKS